MTTGAVAVALLLRPGRSKCREHLGFELAHQEEDLTLKVLAPFLFLWEMAKGSQQQQPSQGLGADVIQLLEQLERHCLAPDGSYVSKASYSDLLLAREEMSRERTRYLEAMALYYEVIAMVEEYQQLQCGGSLGGPRDTQGLYPQPGSMGSQVLETLERHLVTAEAAQRLRLPLLSRDCEVHDEDIAKWSGISRSSFESSSTTATIDSCSNAISYSSSLTPNIAVPSNDTDFGDVGIGGVPNCFLGITPKFLWQVQGKHVSLPLDITEYHNFLACEIESRLEIKCDKLAEVLQVDEIDSSSTRIPSTRLPERLKLYIEDIEKEETILLEDLYSMDRKFAEHYNVLEQVLGVLIKFVKDLKLHHQHQYDEFRKTWLCKRCQTMNAKLRVLEYLLLRDTYTKDSVEALHRIRKYLLEATEEAAIAYNKAVTRLREYQGVDPHFDTIARKYHEAVQKLNNIQWTIHQVEMDLQRSLDLS